MTEKPKQVGTVMRLAITGHRETNPAYHDMIVEAIRTQILRGHSLVLGGALGVDHLALRLAIEHNAETTVVLPGTIASAPNATRTLLESSCVSVVELGLDLSERGSYLTRNIAMLGMADALLAVWSGNHATGTGYTVNQARKRWMPIVFVMVNGGSRD